MIPSPIPGWLPKWVTYTIEGQRCQTYEQMFFDERAGGYLEVHHIEFGKGEVRTHPVESYRRVIKPEWIVWEAELLNRVQLELEQGG